MSYMRHHAICVTSGIEDIDKALDVARGLGCTVAGPVASTTNGYTSFFVAPDGGKEGWATSHEGDCARDALVKWLETQRYEDGSSSFDWVEVQYGDDADQTLVTRDSDERWRQGDD